MNKIKTQKDYWSAENFTPFEKGGVIGISACADGLKKKVVIDWRFINDGEDVEIDYALYPAKDINDYEPVQDV